MNATEARKITDNALKSKLDEIFLEIERAANEGLDYISMEDLELNYAQAEYLEELGYTVERGTYEVQATISW